MNTTRIAVTMFSVATVSLFTANYHLRKEFTSMVNDAPVVTKTLPAVTIVADKPVIPVLTKIGTGINPSDQDVFNKEYSIKCIYPALTDSKKK